MKLCIKCQAELSDEAKICRECGEIQPSDETSGGDIFSMPYLSANMPVHSAARKKKKFATFTDGKDVVKVIVVPGKLVNVVVK